MKLVILPQAAKIKQLDYGESFLCHQHLVVMLSRDKGRHQIHPHE